jgi:cytosine/adenosine deaminase-related metal-dependent hydrolase
MLHETPDVLIADGLVLTEPGAAPQRAHVVVRQGRIAAVEPAEGPAPLAGALRQRAGRGEPGVRVIDAADRLVVPGFVNAHYHSYDVLAKGLLEDLPFDLWALLSQPAYWGPRPASELRLRTLIGGIECLRNGITCVQDMNSLVPQDEATLDTILSAYAEIGLRVVFSVAVRDEAALDIAPFLPPDTPPEVAALVAGKPGCAATDLAFVAAQLKRLHPLPPTLHWALSPSGPQRCTMPLLEGIGALSAEHALPVTTHVYETPAQRAKARIAYPDQGGSLIERMAAAGLLTPRTTIAHSVWTTRAEIERLAEAGAGVVLNPMANLKLKSGVAPFLALKEAGVRVALGCDNCSCGDTQNMFQAMKLYALLAAGSDPQPTGIDAAAALRAATLGGARAVGLAGEIGAIAPGYRADIALLDLGDIAYQPLNSPVRQLVYAECGRGVRTVLVEGRVVLDEGRVTGVDAAALRAALEDAMARFRHDYAALHARQSAAFPWLLAANRRIAESGPTLDRFIGTATGA